MNNQNAYPVLPEGVRLRAQQEAQSMSDELSGVMAVVVATIDGFDVASVIRSSLDAARISALASSIAAIGQVVSAEASLGRCTGVTIATESGFAVISTVNRRDVSLVINVIADEGAVLGQIMYRAAAAARSLCADE